MPKRKPKTTILSPNNQQLVELRKAFEDVAQSTFGPEITSQYLKQFDAFAKAKGYDAFFMGEAKDIFDEMQRNYHKLASERPINGI